MAKASKKQAKPNQKPGQHRRTAVKRRQHSQVLPRKHEQPAKPKSKSVSNEPKQANQRPKVPFTKRDNVLLIGEGDFSFALSLATHCRTKSLTATCYDSEAELVQKYPSVKATIDKLLATPSKSNGACPDPDKDPSEDDAFEGFSPPASPKPDGDRVSQPSSNRSIHILYGIDATRLTTTHNKALRRLGPFTKIIFNFPHVGGLSTDVNRQVRANQALLVAFFESAKPLLVQASAAANSTPSQSEPKSDRYDTDTDSSTSSTSSNTSHPPPPQILVTLFTSAPYTLWNIRDLARHAGLSIAESFRFPWAAYAGYTHARTLGDIVTSGKDRDRSSAGAEGDQDQGQSQGQGKRRPGAWRGEEREARTYVLELKSDGGGRSRGLQQQQQSQQQRKKKRKRADNDDDESEDSE